MFRMVTRNLFCAAVFLLSIAPAFAPAFAQGGVAEDGKDEFEAKCSKCHSVDAAAGAGTGPNLHAIIGVPAGSRAGFTFSDPLKASGLTWTDANLARFIENPAATVPGNRMAGSYMGTTAEIAADIVAYLKTAGGAAPAQ
jgi:cytochrome c